VCVTNILSVGFTYDSDSSTKYKVQRQYSKMIYSKLSPQDFVLCPNKYRFAPRFCALSSVGLEHYLDRVGVTGSNPVVRTFLLEIVLIIID
jgi:hypothetical protein